MRNVGISRPEAGERPTEEVALGLLIALLGFGPLAFGCVESWAREWLRFGALLVVGLVAWTNPAGLFTRSVRALVIPAVALVFLGLLQLVPLPRPVLKTISPNTVKLYDRVVPPQAQPLGPWLLERAKREGIRLSSTDLHVPHEVSRGDATAGRTISIYPEVTRQAVLNWGTAILFFLAAAGLSRSPLARYRLLWAVSAWSALLGLIAIAQRISWNGKLLWFRPRPPGSQPLGPYVNPNHLAGYAELGVLVSLGLVLALLSRSSGRLELRAVHQALLDREWTLPRLLAAGAAACLAVAGVALSGSRSAYVALGLGVFMMATRWRLRWVVPIMVGAVAMAGVGVGIASSLGGTATELENVLTVSAEPSPSLVMRMDTWNRTLNTVKDFPLLGTGLGTFPWSFARYQRRGEWLVWEEAHNDYLQLLSEAGLAGGLILVFGLGVFVFRIILPLWSEAPPRWTTVGCVAAVVAMLAHSIVEFNLQIPANAALFAVLAGIVTAASEAAQEQRTQP